MTIDGIGLAALAIVVERYKAHGIRPYIDRCEWGEHNVFRMVDVGRDPNALGGAQALAEDLIRLKVLRFVELPTLKVVGDAVCKTFTDISSGVSIRVNLSKAGIVFDAAGIGEPIRRES